MGENVNSYGSRELLTLRRLRSQQRHAQKKAKHAQTKH